MMPTDQDQPMREDLCEDSCDKMCEEMCEEMRDKSRTLHPVMGSAFDRLRARGSRPRWRLGLGAIATFLAVGMLAVSAYASAPTPPGDDDADAPVADADAKTSADDDEEKKEKEEPEDRYFAIKAGLVHTVTNGDLRNVVILAKNGKIERIGANIVLPEDCEVLDATGHVVYPGLVAVSSGSVLGSEPPDDTTDVFSLYMTIGLAGGITTAVTGNTAAHLTYGTVDDMIVKRDLLKSLAYSTSNPEGRRKLRADLDKVRQYMRDLQRHKEQKKRDPEAEAPDKEWLKGQYKDYYKLLRGETTAVMTANTAQEILSVCDLAERYGLHIVVRGAVEGWTVASQMGRAGVSAIITPRADRSANETLNRPTGSSIANAATLHGHGVPIAIIPQITAITLWGVAGQDLLHLRMEAGFAVRGGLSNEAALRAITIDAARILGIDHRVGSIEVGKDADFAITDGDILHYMKHVRWAVVGGRIAYDKQKDTLYDHIRPDGKETTMPDDYWPRRLGAD